MSSAARRTEISSDEWKPVFTGFAETKASLELTSPLGLSHLIEAPEGLHLRVSDTLEYKVFQNKLGEYLVMIYVLNKNEKGQLQVVESYDVTHQFSREKLKHNFASAVSAAEDAHQMSISPFSDSNLSFSVSDGSRYDDEGLRSHVSANHSDSNSSHHPSSSLVTLPLSLPGPVMMCAAHQFSGLLAASNDEDLSPKEIAFLRGLLKIFDYFAIRREEGCYHNYDYRLDDFLALLMFFQKREVPVPVLSQLVGWGCFKNRYRCHRGELERAAEFLAPEKTARVVKTFIDQLVVKSPMWHTVSDEVLSKFKNRGGDIPKSEPSTDVQVLSSEKKKVQEINFLSGLLKMLDYFKIRREEGGWYNDYCSRLKDFLALLACFQSQQMAPLISRFVRWGWFTNRYTELRVTLLKTADLLDVEQKMKVTQMFIGYLENELKQHPIRHEIKDRLKEVGHQSASTASSAALGR